ncbi:hypothetical protein Tco_0502767 [Tanacetum coccineum]
MGRGTLCIDDRVIRHTYFPKPRSKSYVEAFEMEGEDDWLGSFEVGRDEDGNVKEADREHRPPGGGGEQTCCDRAALGGSASMVYGGSGRAIVCCSILASAQSFVGSFVQRVARGRECKKQGFMDDAAL